MKFRKSDFVWNLFSRSVESINWNLERQLLQITFSVEESGISQTSHSLPIKKSEKSDQNLFNLLSNTF